MSLARLPAWAYLLIGLAPMMILLALGGIVPKSMGVIAASAATLWAGVMIAAHWKRLDEAARMAHRWAWYWGSSFGLILAIAVAALGMLSPDAWSVISTAAKPFVSEKVLPEQSFLFLGVMLMGVAQGVGFLCAWVYWWPAKR